MTYRYYHIATCFSLLLLLGVGCGDYADTQYIDPARTLDPNGLNCRGVSLDASGGVVDVYKLDDGYCYAAGLFTKPTEPDNCDSTHFHYTILSIDGSQTRRDQGDCGAATVMQIENKGPIHVSNTLIEEWNQQWATLQQQESTQSDFSIE